MQMEHEIERLAQQLSEAHWYAVATTLLSITLLALFAFLVAYLKRKGEQLTVTERILLALVAYHVWWKLI